MNYLKSTKDIPLTLEDDNSVCIRCWVDASFAVHPDMKSHSGAMMPMGQGAAISGSKKQKLNTKRLTESELVRVDDYMPMIIWVKYFLEAQGYTVSIIYYTKTTRARLNWSKIKKRRAENAQGTLQSDTIS